MSALVPPPVPQPAPTNAAVPRRRADSWLWQWVLLLLALATLPFVLAQRLTPPGAEFTGMLLNPVDGFSYLAKMREATYGAWSIQLPYVAEEHQNAFIYLLYVFLGKVTAVTGLPAILVYHGGRIAAALFMLLSLAAFLRQICARPAVQRTAFLFAALGGGLTWLTSLFGFIGAEVGIPESNLFASAFSNPHFPLATGLLLLVATVALSRERVGTGRLIAASAANVTLTMLQPFLLVTEIIVGASWAALLLWRRICSVSDLRRRWRAVAILLGPASLVALFLTQRLYSDPVLAEWTAQNINLSPPPTSYLVGYGVLVPFALVGLRTLWQRPETVGLSQRDALAVIAWAVAGCWLLYAPVAFQRRLSEGLVIPLAVLAAAGLYSLGIGDNLRRYLRSTAIGVGLVSCLWLGGTSVLGAVMLGAPHYLSLSDSTALAWLGSQGTSRDLVLASPAIGNVVPAFSGAQTYWGHPYETPKAAERLSNVQRFYHARTSNDERCRLLRDAGISLVYAGLNEQRLGGALLDGQQGLATAYQNETVTIYKVVPCPTQR